MATCGPNPACQSCCKSGLRPKVIEEPWPRRCMLVLWLVQTNYYQHDLTWTQCTDQGKAQRCLTKAKRREWSHQIRGDYSFCGPRATFSVSTKLRSRCIESKMCHSCTSQKSALRNVNLFCFNMPLFMTLKRSDSYMVGTLGSGEQQVEELSHCFRCVHLYNYIKRYHPRMHLWHIWVISGWC